MFKEVSGQQITEQNLEDKKLHQEIDLLEIQVNNFKQTNIQNILLTQILPIIGSVDILLLSTFSA